MKKRIVLSTLILIMCCTCMLVCGCSDQSSPSGTAKKYLSAVQEDDIDTLTETVAPSELGLFDFSSSPETFMSSILTYALKDLDLDNCYIDKKIIVEGNCAVAYLKCDDYEIPYNDSKICLVKEDGVWYVTMDSFVLDEETPESLTNGSAMTLEEVKQAHAVNKIDYFVKTDDKYYPVSVNTMYLPSTYAYFSKDEPAEVPKGSQIISFEDGYEYYANDVTDYSKINPYYINFEDYKDSQTLYKINFEANNLYYESLGSDFEINDKEPTRKNIKALGFTSISESDDYYINKVTNNNTTYGWYSGIDYAEDTPTDSINYYLTGDKYTDINKERTKDGYEILDTSNLNTGLYVIGKSYASIDEFIINVK